LRTTALVADGEIQDIPLLAEIIKTFHRVVAVDGGLKYCHSMGIEPHKIVGDFDSCPRELLKRYSHVLSIILPQDKDKTDLEVAIEAEISHSDSIAIFGGWGKRMDHSLTNALILTRYPGRVYLETEKEILFALKPTTRLNCFAGQTLSLIPLNGPVLGITTSGLKWELSNAQLDCQFVGISNVCLKSIVEIQYTCGSLLCCQQKI
jgi:thiamine pyrophosphokinase